MKSSGTLGTSSFGIGKKGTIFVDSTDITVLQSVLFLRMALIFRHIKLLSRFLAASSQKCSKRQFQIQILSALLCFRRSLLIVVYKNIFEKLYIFPWQLRKTCNAMRRKKLSCLTYSLILNCVQPWPEVKNWRFYKDFNTCH